MIRLSLYYSGIHINTIAAVRRRMDVGIRMRDAAEEFGFTHRQMRKAMGEWQKAKRMRWLFRSYQAGKLAQLKQRSEA